MSNMKLTINKLQCTQPEEYYAGPTMHAYGRLFNGIKICACACVHVCVLICLSINTQCVFSKNKDFFT